MFAKSRAIGHYHECPNCKEQFTPEQLVNDPNLVPIGLCLVDDQSRSNYFFLKHETPACQTTFATPVEVFQKFLPEIVPQDINTGMPDCEGHCKKIDDNDPCYACCYFAPFRSLLATMRVIKAANAAQPVVELEE